MKHEARIKGLTPDELVAIIENEKDYKPEVIAFAEAELKNRDIDSSLIETLTTQHRARKDQELAMAEERLSNQAKWQEKLYGLLGEKSRLLLIASILMAVIVTINLPDVISLIQFISEDGRSWDWVSVGAILPTILFIVATIGLFLEGRWAWFLSVIILSFTITKVIVWIIYINQSYGNSIVDLIFQYNQSYFDYVAFGNLILCFAPLIILLLASVRERLQLPRWSLFVALLGIGIGLLLFGDMLVPQEPLRIEAPIDQGPIILELEYPEAPNQEQIESMVDSINQLQKN